MDFDVMSYFFGILSVILLWFISFLIRVYITGYKELKKHGVNPLNPDEVKEFERKHKRNA